MLIKDLISELQALYHTYDDEYKSVAGEPEIMIDVFKRTYPDGCNFQREYVGISGFIKIERSSCGVYPILSAFDETQDYDPSKEAAQSPSNSLPWPKVWKA